MFLDLVFSELGHYEMFCIKCGKRPMIAKESETGRWMRRNLVPESMPQLRPT